METEQDQVIDTDQAVNQEDSVPSQDQLDQEEEARKEAEAQEEKERQEVEQKPWFRKRIDEITRQKYEEKARAEAAAQKVQELEQRLSEIESKNKKPQELNFTQPKPRLEDFEKEVDDPDEAMANYVDAVTDWKIEQREAIITQERERANKARELLTKQQTFEQKRQATISAGEAKYSDFFQLVSSIPGQIMNRQVTEIISDLKDGHEVAYFLSKNLQEAERISKLSPYAMAAELGKIESRLTTTEKKRTSAPPPPNPVKGKAHASSEIDPDKDPEAWIAARNRGEI